MHQGYVGFDAHENHAGGWMEIGKCGAAVSRKCLDQVVARQKMESG
jgi:hypothetical protein